MQVVTGEKGNLVLVNIYHNHLLTKQLQDLDTRFIKVSSASGTM